jgi:hypothetical protein
MLARIVITINANNIYCIVYIPNSMSSYSSPKKQPRVSHIHIAVANRRGLLTNQLVVSNRWQFIVTTCTCMHIFSISIVYIPSLAKLQSRVRTQRCESHTPWSLVTGKKRDHRHRVCLVRAYTLHMVVSLIKLRTYNTHGSNLLSRLHDSDGHICGHYIHV